MVFRHPSEKWKSVGIIIPSIWKNIVHVPNHQPVMWFWMWKMPDSILIHLQYHLHVNLAREHADLITSTKKNTWFNSDTHGHSSAKNAAEPVRHVIVFHFARVYPISRFDYWRVNIKKMDSQNSHKKQHGVYISVNPTVQPTFRMRDWTNSKTGFRRQICMYLNVIWFGFQFWRLLDLAKLRVKQLADNRLVLIALDPHHLLS